MSSYPPRYINKEELEELQQRPKEKLQISEAVFLLQEEVEKIKRRLIELEGVD